MKYAVEFRFRGNYCSPDCPMLTDKTDRTFKSDIAPEERYGCALDGVRLIKDWRERDRLFKLHVVDKSKPDPRVIDAIRRSDKCIEREIVHKMAARLRQ